MKCCSRCHKTKPLKDFAVKRRNKSGVDSHCKACHNIINRRHYRANKQYYIDKADARQKKAAQAVLEYLMEHPCKCGEKDPEVLDFDHFRDKKYNICKMILNGCSLRSIFEEIAKCVVRCANCHRRKTAREQGWFRILAPVV